MIDKKKAQQITVAPTNQSDAELAKVRGRVNAHAETVLEQKFAHSQIVDASHKLPRFSLEEVIKGKYLGKGFFGMVYEIQGLDGRDQKGNIIQQQQPPPKSTAAWICGKQQVHHDRNESEDDDDILLGPGEDPLESDDDDDDEEQCPDPARKAAARKQEAARCFMRRHCRRENGQTRYALKILRPEVLKDPTKLYFQGVMDMQSETRLLSSIQHPHIIKLRAIAAASPRGKCHEDFFLIIDRLYQVLEDQLKVWERQNKLHTGLVGKVLLDRRGRKRAQLWEDRLVAAHDLASALGYLHSRRIIHRDLKSDNIGFDIRGDIKIFDFGLARELPSQAQASERGTWKMTGSTGTPRYMSPEVALDKPYNQSCDTYSFCMMLWEILALKTPFELYTMKSFVARVWNSPHKRPQLDPTWPKSIHLLLQQGWNPIIEERPPMTSLAETLRKEVIQCREDADQRWGLDVLAERRSTHVFIEEEDMDKSHKGSILSSIFASPFHRKSPFRLGGKPSLSRGSSPAVASAFHNDDQVSPSSKNNKTILSLDVIKATVACALSPSTTLLDFSGSNTSTEQRVNSLPSKPPLFDDDDYSSCGGDQQGPVAQERSSVSITQENTEEDSIEGQDDSDVDDIMLYQSPRASAIWERIENEKARREKIRQRLFAIHQDVEAQ